MNKIVASLGMVALGAAGLSTASAQDAPPQKFWNVSASLRGFYDDNRFTLPDSNPNKKDGDTFGFQVSPTVGLNWEQEATKIQLGYTYSLKYFDKTFDDGITKVDHDDQSHTFIAMLDHAFSERYHMSLNDSFVIGQEPDTSVQDPGGIAVPFRISGDNIRNFGAIKFDADLTPLFGIGVGYNNGYFNYDDATLSQSLDRVEHTGNVEGRWRALPKTTGLLGYKYRQTDYSESGSGLGTGDDRNRRSHIGYVGIEQVFNPEFSASAQAGVEVAEYPNAIIDDSSTSPYAQVALTYRYMPESYIQVGLNHQRISTDVVGVSGTDFVKDSEATTIYGQLHHLIVPHLFGDLKGTLQNSELNGGPNDGDSETFYSLSVELEYEITAYLSAELGYNYDKLVSDLANRGYDRNRVYIGLTARY